MDYMVYLLETSCLLSLRWRQKIWWKVEKGRYFFYSSDNNLDLLVPDGFSWTWWNGPMDYLMLLDYYFPLLLIDTMMVVSPGLLKSLIERWRIWSIKMIQTRARCWMRKNNQWLGHFWNSILILILVLHACIYSLLRAVMVVVFDSLQVKELNSYVALKKQWVT